jgi:hypothetical protein
MVQEVVQEALMHRLQGAVLLLLLVLLLLHGMCPQALTNVSRWWVGKMELKVA